jgi:arylsulfatase A-like enzyme
MISSGFAGLAPPAETVRAIAGRIEMIYAAAVRETDEAVGELLEALRRLGAFDKFVIVVSSDHGEEFGERGRFGHAASNLHAEITRVPLMLRLPKFFGLAGRRVASPVMNLDILPTLLAVTGLHSPVPLMGFEPTRSGKTRVGSARLERA